MRAAGLRPGAGQTGAPERLHADHRADHVAVDVDIAHREPFDHRIDHIVDPRMDAKRQPIAGALDRGQHVVETVGRVAYDMQNWTEYFFSELVAIRQFKNMRRDILAFWRPAFKMHARLAFHPHDVRLQPRFGLSIDHGADMNAWVGGLADLQFARGA